MQGWMRACALIVATLIATLPIHASSLELETIQRAAANYNNPNEHLQEMFRAALLDTGKLAEYAPDGTAYIKTGDIPAEWLRDASAQSRPYLFFAKNDPDTRTLMRAIIASFIARSKQHADPLRMDLAWYMALSAQRCRVS